MKSLAQLKTKLLKNPQTRAEYDALAGEFETAPSYEETVKSQIHPVDWAWANESLTLPIFAAVGLSLGYEINTLAPVDQAWKNRPFVQPPEEYKRRVATTYEAVRIGKLSCLTTNKIGSTFDVTARFSDAQFWEVSMVEFRRFCDDRGWQVPADFLPNGYAPTDPAPAQAAASPAHGANSASTTPVVKPKARRCTWWDVSSAYIVEVMQAGQYATCKELYRALEEKAGPGSPFEKGTRDNRGSLFVRDIAKPLSLHTVQNKWANLRELAKKMTP